MTFTWAAGFHLVGKKEVFIAFIALIPSMLQKYTSVIPLADKYEKENTEYSNRDLTEQGHIH